MFVNISNHDSSNWSREQVEHAFLLSETEVIIDVPFPQVDARLQSEAVKKMAQELHDKVLLDDRITPENSTIMVSGEFTLTYALVELFKADGFTVVAACTERVSEEKVQPDGSVLKTSKFEFVRFRAY